MVQSFLGPRLAVVSKGVWPKSRLEDQNRLRSPRAPGIRHRPRVPKSPERLLGSWGRERKAARAEAMCPGGAEVTTAALQRCRTWLPRSWQHSGDARAARWVSIISSALLWHLQEEGEMQTICSYKTKAVWFCTCVYLMVGVLLGKTVSDNLKTDRAKSLCTS